MTTNVRPMCGIQNVNVHLWWVFLQINKFYNTISKTSNGDLVIRVVATVIYPGVSIYLTQQCIICMYTTHDVPWEY